MSDKKVRVVLELDGKQYAAELQTATRDTQAFTQGLAAGARNASGHVDVLTSGIGRLTQGMAGLAAGAVGAISAREFIQAADAVTTLNNQLKLATGSTQAAGKAYEALFDIAQRSRVSFTELGGTYASIARAGQELGISQTRLLAVTESIGNAMTISGGSAEGMKAALMQLSQGLASGTLRGEELNSVMEQAPRLAKALADGMGIPIGKLREMGAAGQITAQQVISALESQSAVLRGEVSGAVMTVGQAFTQLQNASVKAVGDFDKASGASNTLAQAISGLSGAVGAVGKAFKDNETAITTTLGVLGGAGVAAGLARTGTALVGVATGIGGVSGAITVLKGVVAGLNPITLGLLGLGAVVGGVSAYNAAHADDIDRMASKLKELEAIQARGGKTIYGGESTAAQVKERVAEIERLRTAIAAFNEEKARGNIIPSGGSAERELAAANRKAADSYDELKIRLSGFKGDYAKYAADLKQIQEGMAKGKANGGLSEQEGIAMLTELAKKHGEVAKAAGARKPYEDQLAASAHSYAEAMKKLTGNSIDAESAAAGYTKTQKDLLEIFASPGFASMPDVWKQAIVAQAEGVIAAEQLSAANKALAASEVEAAKAENDRIDAARKGADGAVAKLQALKDEEAALVMAAAQHITLAQAIEQVAITRLREQQTALMREDDRDSEVLAIQREIDARKKLVDALGTKGVREAAEKGAKATADAYERRTEQIEQSLTDALMRGGKSGADYVEGLFRTTAFRVLLDPIVKPLSGVLSSAVNTVIGGTGSSVLGTAANAASIYNAGSAIYGMGGIASSAGIISGATYGTAAGSAQSIMLAGQEIGGSIGGAMIAGAESASSILSVAFDPITLGIGALVAVLASMDDSGTMHMGGAAIADSVAGIKEIEAATIGFGLAAADVSDKVVGSSKTLAGSVLSILQGLDGLSGGKSKFSVSAGYADDSSDDNSWGAFRVTRDGQSLVDWQDTRTSRWAPKEFADGEAGATQYGTAVAASVKQAIDQIELPDWAANIVKQLGDSPSMDELSAAMAKIQAMPAQALQAIGTSSQALSGIIYTGMQAGDPAGAGAAFAGQITYGIESSLYSGFSQQITGIISTQLVTPVVTAMASGATITEAMATVSVDAMKAQVAAAGAAFAAIVNDPGFKDALASVGTLISDTVSASTAGLTAPTAPAAYTSQVTTVAPPAATAVGNLSNAVDDLRKKAESAVDSLKSTSADLEIELLRAQGNEKGALSKERANYLAQYADLAQAEQGRIAQLYDGNQAIREQIAALEKADAVSSQYAGLERQLLELQGETAALRKLEVAEIDPGNRAIQERIWQLQDEKTAAEKAAAASEKLRSAISGMYSAADASAGKFLAGPALADYQTGRIAQQLNEALGSSIKGADLAAVGIDQIKTAVLGFVSSDAAPDAKTAVLQLGASLIDLKQSAIDAAQAAAKAVADQRAGLESTLWGLVGDTDKMRARELAALDPTNRALQTLIYRVTDLKTAADKANTGIDTAYSGLQKSVDMQKTALAERLAADKEALAAQAEAAQDAVGNVRGIFDAIKSAIKSTTVETDALSRAARDRSMSVLQSALAQARTGVRVDSLPGVTDALGVLSKPADKLYARFDDYARAQDAAADVMRELGDQAGGQLSVAELTLKATKGATSELEKAYSLEVRALDKTLDQWRTSIEIQRGTYLEVMTIPQAIDRMSTALAASAAATAAALAARPAYSPAPATYSPSPGTSPALGPAPVITATAQNQDPLSAYSAAQVTGAVDYVRAAASTGDAMSVYQGAVAAGMTVDQVVSVMGLAGVNAIGADDVRAWVSASGLAALPEAPKRFAIGGAFLGGGVVQRPTHFDIGQMAEEGPEAIMPLASINGRLGILASGGGSSPEMLAATLVQNVLLGRIAAAAEAGAMHGYGAAKAAQEIVDRGVKVMPGMKPIETVAA